MLKPGGALLIANLSSFNTACVDSGWVKDSAGQHLHYPVDNYLEERSQWIEYRRIRVVNHHRPLSTYMRTLLTEGLHLSYFDEPAPTPGAGTESDALSSGTVVRRHGMVETRLN